MSKEKRPSTEHYQPRPLTEEKGLQPAKSPPVMPQVKPPKSEKGG
tara:strand:- start:1944 stop:2078 length:135 start_codon:yes stop_codon:yes gene_type:complete